MSGPGEGRRSASAGRASGGRRDDRGGRGRNPRAGRRPTERSAKPPLDIARRTALAVLRQVTGGGAYANLALSDALSAQTLNGPDAALVTELVSGACRGMGSYDRVIEAASGRALKTLQPAVVDVLRLATHQLLGMQTPAHAVAASWVQVARVAIGERVTGVVNAIIRRIAARDWDEWVELIGADLDDRDRLALATLHPRWIVDAWADVLPADELGAALNADNLPPVPTLVVRPGLAERDELLADQAVGRLDRGTRETTSRPDDADAAVRSGRDADHVTVAETRFSPFGVRRPGNPSGVAAVREARAGVQDEGSQLVAWALSRATTDADGPWLDACAGPGGKSALLTGLALEAGTWLLAGELQPHRAQLVRQALAAYPPGSSQVVVADGRQPAWSSGSFARVMCDVPCSGLGALRRRPDARWRKLDADIAGLHDLQLSLLQRGLDAVTPGGVVAYVTCSPHRHETIDVVLAALEGRDDVEVIDAPAVLSEVPDAAAMTDPRFVQLWPHRHGADALFLALLRRR